ncbi:hypothetical protein ACFOLC_00200 [Lysobacter cavernae]|uniref:Uncharacterized protein n=1 Tax=Lysobacter cavernae TaxID=1685901 RepID=A0ABV7RJE3_9GAMM
MSAPSLPTGLTYVLSEDEVTRLWRAKHAATLLAAFDGDTANLRSVTRDNLAAVADYIAEDVENVLRQAEKRRAQSHPPTFPTPGQSKSEP